jgi:hypothetical protein
MVEFHIGLEELACPLAIKEDLETLNGQYARYTGAKSTSISSIIFHPKQLAGSRSYVVKAKFTADGEDLFFAQAESWDVEEAITKALLGLSNQLRHRLFFLQWQNHMDAVHAN